MPPAYIQRSEDYWYYCTDPPGYYPYVTYCRSAWLTVVPQPETGD